MRNKKGFVLLALALVAVAGFVAWRKFKKEDLSYRSINVERGDLEINILSTGTVQPENRLEIKPPIAGRVETVLVKEGQKVQKGQLLAWMSSTERAAMLDAARSKGPEEVKRWEELYRPTPVLAPISGTIIQRNVESGQTFTTNDAVLVMSDRLTVKAQVDETDIAKIKLGQEAEITLDAYPERNIAARVDQIAFDSKTVNNVTTYLVDVLPEQAVPVMRSGMTANVSFRLQGKQGVLLIPTESIRQQGDKSVVLVRVTGQERPADREIQTGLSDGRRTEVTQGLSDGDVVMIQQIKAKSQASGAGSPFGRPKGPKRGKGAH